MSLARTLYEIFYEGCNAYAIGNTDKPGYTTVYGIPTLKEIQQHLKGIITLGAYTVLPGNNVRWMAFDVDSKVGGLRKAREIAKKLCDFLKGVSYAIEFSGSKGYHVFIFFDKVITAKDAKDVGDKICEILGLSRKGDPHVEVFPKQEILTESHPLGSLVRLPLGLHPSTKRKGIFIDPQDKWEEGDEKDTTQIFAQRTSLSDLQDLVEEPESDQQIANILAPYWTSGSRHDLALCTAGYLASVGWTEEGVHDLVKLLHEQDESGDIDNQLEAVTDTFEKTYEGKAVVGFQGLAEILPANSLRKLVELASKQSSTATIQLIDRIRLGKGQTWQKVRLASRTVLSYFRENGKLVKDINSTYWLDYTSRKLITIGGPQWEGFMHNGFGLNPLESFGRQVTVSVNLLAAEQAKMVSVYKKAYWSRKELYLNLGGPEVYVLSGDPKKRRVILNGEEDILFLSSNDSLHIPNLQELDIESVDPWKFLVNDLNFLTGGNVNASPIQQRELFKAFILSIFFSQILPTRPILALLASSGAGKTTSARRILRFFEGLQEEVLGVVPDKPDSFRSSIVAHKLLVLDNLEKTKAAWLTDTLNRLSTGGHIEVRKLHTTNELFRIIPDCHVIITATEMPFSEETVFTRMLPIELAQLTASRSEYDMETQLAENFNALWKGMLDHLDGVVAELRKVQTIAAPNDSRLADFTVFCSKIQEASCLNGKELMAGLSTLVSRQKQVLEENSPFVESLIIWMRSRGDEKGRFMTISELFSALQRVASANHIDWRWSASQGLSRHVSMLEPQLTKHFGLTTKKSMENGREIKLYKFDRKMLEM